MKELPIDKALHSVAVANRMLTIAKQIKPNEDAWIKDMWLLGYLHDIGYCMLPFDAPDITAEHTKLGAEYLKVSGFVYWKEVFYHGKVQDEYTSLELNILNISDMTTDTKGNYVTMEERYVDVCSRYGEDSPTSWNFLTLKNKLLTDEYFKRLCII